MIKQKLCILAKNPILGRAKTRIGKVKGDQIALEVYKRLLTYTRDMALATNVPLAIYFDQYIEKGDFWPDNYFSKHIQAHGDLGIKMSTCFQNELKYAEKAIIIGADCAELDPTDIQKAFSSLDRCDIVIGPASDGGYYLLAMKKFHGFLFEDMPWSQENLLEQTLDKIKSQRLSVILLDEKSDVDHWEDWKKVGWEL